MEKRSKRHSEEDEEGCSVEQTKLPNDVITQQILPCLPIKHLTQCKLVSKEWNSTISTPNFILNHFQKTVFSDPFSPLETLLIYTGGNNFYLYSCDDENNKLVKLNAEFDLSDSDSGKSNFIGSCNGLICFAHLYGEYFNLRNPTTNQCHKYYHPDKELLWKIRRDIFAHWGMAYVSALDDYKVVRILFNKRNRDEIPTLVDNFSLKTNTWRRVERGLDTYTLINRPKLVNETVYWIGFDFYNEKPPKIFGFDLGLETFHFMPHLVSLNHPNYNMMCVMGGCLSMCSPNSQKDFLIDIVKHPGRVVSLRLPCGGMSQLINFDDLPSYVRVHFRDLIGFTRTGKIIVSYGDPPRLVLVGLNSTTPIAMLEGLGVNTHLERFVPSEVSTLPPPANGSGQVA